MIWREALFKCFRAEETRREFMIIPKDDNGVMSICIKDSPAYPNTLTTLYPDHWAMVTLDEQVPFHIVKLIEQYPNLS